jgi:hypothetical protein
VLVRIAHAPTAATDEERCDRREFWLHRSEGDTLIAHDCESQWGADTTGTATVKVGRSRIEVNYVEYQSNDGCEILRASIRLIGTRVQVSQRRVVGTVRKNRCIPTGRNVPIEPAGDGSAEHPLIVLHR